MHDVPAALRFILECEKLKAVERRSMPLGLSRRENSAEHSWSLILAAMTIMPPELDALRVLQMLAVHDVVEIDAGDTFCYADQTGKRKREEVAASRIFGLLPVEAAREFRALWEEFEAQASAESRFANAMDRLLPILQNHANGGGAWKEHDLAASQVLTRNAIIGQVSPELGRHLASLVADAVAQGWLRDA